jgi:mRNA-degrading endonuclease RelE of RelBE toxin-antitoxin system
MATVVLTPGAVNDLHNLPRGIVPRITQVLERLEKWPAVSGAKPMRGALACHFRVRTGDYRVLFTVKEDAVTVVKIGYRGGFYDD